MKVYGIQKIDIIKELYKSSISTNARNTHSLEFSIKLPDNLDLITKALTDFDEDSQATANGNVYDSYDLPSKTCNGFCQLLIDNLDIYCANDIVQIADLYYDRTNSNLEIEYDTFALPQGLYKKEDMEKEPEIAKALLACDIYNALISISDEDLPSSFFIRGDGSLMYEKTIKREYITSLEQANIFLSTINEKDGDLITLMKSEINAICRSTKANQRTRAFFENFDTIVENFVTNKAIYLSRFTTENIKRNYKAECIGLMEKLRKPISALESELIVFLTMYFTLSEFSPSKGFSAINILIIAGMSFAAIICTAIFSNANKELKIVKEISSSKIQELEDFGESRSTREIIADFKSILKQTNAYYFLFLISKIAIFIPSIISIILCFTSSGAPSEQAPTASM